MSWVKISNDLYINTNSSYSIEKIDETWNLIDSKEKRNFIPISDIYNNPVFPFPTIDFPNTDLIVKSLESLSYINGESANINEVAKAKHFRGEISDTPETPAFSSQGDPNTGFYHISNGKFGYSSNGLKMGEFGNGYGGFKGNILQVQSSHKLDTTTFGNAYGSVSGLSVSITPKFNNSKILILLNVHTGVSVANTSNLKIQRNGTDILLPTGIGTRIPSHSSVNNPTTTPTFTLLTQSISLVDDPQTTNEIIYTTQARIHGSGAVGYINRQAADADTLFYSRPISSIIAMEIMT